MKWFIGIIGIIGLNNWKFFFRFRPKRVVERRRSTWTNWSARWTTWWVKTTSIGNEWSHWRDPMLVYWANWPSCRPSSIGSRRRTRGIIGVNNLLPLIVQTKVFNWVRRRPKLIWPRPVIVSCCFIHIQNYIVNGKCKFSD